MGILDYFLQPKGLTNLSPDEVLALQESGTARLIDVRTSYEFGHSHITGAESHPLDSIGVLASSLDKKSDILLICATGHRSRAAAHRLIKSGFSNISHLDGGMRAWNKAGKETTTE